MRRTYTGHRSGAKGAKTALATLVFALTVSTPA
jgi:hypothetical protein